MTVVWIVAGLAAIAVAVWLYRQGRIRRFRQVNGILYRGGQPRLLALWFLAKVKGVRTIVNLRADAIDLDESRFGMREVRIPLPGGTNVPTLEQVREFLAIVDDPANHPVLVHCKVGADRTGFMVAMWRMLREDWDYERALAELESTKGKPTTDLHKQLLQEFPAAIRRESPGN